MRFLVDECTGVVVANWLRRQNYEVFSVYEQARGLDDEDVVKKAFAENWVLITNDKDFGEKVYREGYPHRGIILLRLDDERSTNKIKALQLLLTNYVDKLIDHFVVVTEQTVRVRPK
jgi:predicted nuclease of predicted toxin-antitoxin system